MKEREETRKKPTKSNHGIGTLAGKAPCVRAARPLPDSQKVSRKYPTYHLHLRHSIREKFLQKYCLFWYFKHIQVPDFTDKKEIFIYVVHDSSGQGFPKMYLHSLSARVLGRKTKPNQPPRTFHRMIPEFSSQISLCINSWLHMLFWGFKDSISSS